MPAVEGKVASTAGVTRICTLTVCEAIPQKPYAQEKEVVVTTPPPKGVGFSTHGSVTAPPLTVEGSVRA